MSRSESAETLYCPHLQDVDDGTLQELFSKVAAVRSQNRELFDFTHRRIDVYSKGGDGSDVVSEDEVFEKFKEGRKENFATVIEGEVGTGKSELCAYLAHRLKDAGRPLLHVDKEDDLMTLLSDRLPDFYEEQFGEEMEGAADFQQLRDDIESMPQVVANSAVSNAILNLRQRGGSVSVESGQEDEIREFVQGKLKLLVEKGEYAQQIQFITDQEYKQNEFLQIFDHTPASEAVDLYNEELWRVVRGRYETASLSEVLKQVGAEFTDRRPVIVFEDFSITAMEAGQLAKFIESDQTESPWDFIIAGTRDSTAPLGTRTAESRYEYYQTNERNSQEVLFLDTDSAVDFVRPYLGYFKSFDGSVRYDRDPETGTFELLPAKSGSRCADCGLCDESFRDLFPFNKPFLKRIYAGMAEEDKQSPREFIMTVFDVLSRYYEGKVAVPSDAKELRSLVNRVSVADAVYEQAESFAHLARWYGVVNDDENRVEIDKRLGEVFGLLEPVEDVPDAVTVTEASIYVPAVGGDDGGGGGSRTGKDDGGDGGNDGGGNDTGGDVGPVEQEFQELAPLLDTWRNAPEKSRETTKYLERGLEDALKRLTDDYALYEGTDLEYRLSSQKRPFVFSIMETQRDEDQILIDPEEFRLSNLRTLLRFGIEREMQPRSAKYDVALEALGTQLTEYARSWREQVRFHNLERDEVLYKGYQNYDFDDFVLAAYAYVVMLDDPWEELTAERVCNRFDEGEYELDKSVRSFLEDELEREAVDAIESFLAAGSHLEAMAGELFGLGGSDLDKLRVERWFRKQSPRDVLNQLGRGYIQNIESRVRFDGGPKLRDLADTAYDVRGALDEVRPRYRDDTVENVLSDLRGISMPNLQSMVSNLQTYNVDPDVMEPLTQFSEVSQSTVDEATSAAELADSLRTGSKFASVQATLASVKLERATVYERYQAVPLKSGGNVDGLGKQFQEVAEYYVE
ncbi:ATP-binding protein [Haloarchaeobius litoreus]|uniref:ATP-binding protein n=1 Tax=Haloarchaeobius litoreus TaxID=755306 RepID=A0ABD6DKL9_9EURY|nr:ATP-binding protein [Haloarchaeobius litoreus]